MNRNIKIDCSRGIAIILVVLGHCEFKYRDIIYLFHMPLFFMITGYLWNEEHSSNIKSTLKYITNKFKELYIPYMLFNLLWVLLNNFFVNLGIYNSDKLLTKNEIMLEIFRNLLFIGNTQMGGPYWFLRVMFMLTSIWCLIDFTISSYLKMCNKTYIQLAISILLLALGYYMQLTNFYYHGIEIVLSMYSCFYLGTTLQKILVQSIPFIFSLIIITLTGSSLFVCSKYPTHEISANQYLNPQFLITTSILGFFFIYNLSNIISQNIILAKIISYIGQHTMSIFLLHVLCFDLVDLIQIKINNLDKLALSDFPVINGSHGWWLIYSITGISIPLILEKLFHRLKNYLFNI